jgi:hypothetical protein
MAAPFKGVIKVDIRDSEPDWDPFEPPRAPDGALVSLFHGDQKVGETRIKTQPGKFTLAGEGLCVGRDSVDLEREAVAMMARE